MADSLITEVKINSAGELVVKTSEGKTFNAGVVKGRDGLDGESVNKAEVIKEIASQIPKPDLESLIKKIGINLPREKSLTYSDVLASLRGNKDLSYNDLKDLPDLPALIQQYTSHLGQGTGRGMVHAGASALSRMIDVDLSGLIVGNTIAWNGSYWVPTSSGGVSAISIATANGFAGSSSGGSTPALTLSTTITGILQGNGTTISAASTTGSGSVVLATSPTLVTPTIGSALATAIGMGIAASSTIRLNAVVDSTWGRAIQVVGDSISRSILGSLIVADSDYRFQIDVAGIQQWGTGTTTDTNLYRSAANVLKTDDTFFAAIAVQTPFMADTNGNELLIFTTTASAVNELKITNASTGNNPRFEASGETNVGLVLSGKGNRGVIVDNAFTTKIVTLTDGATPALDASLGNMFTLSAAGDRTIAVPTNPTHGQKILIRHTASGGARTLALNTGTGGFRFGADIPSLSTTSSGLTDYILAIYNLNPNKWDVISVVKGF